MRKYILFASIFAAASLVVFMLLSASEKVGKPSLESVKTALASEGQVVSDEEAREIMYDKRLPLPENPNASTKKSQEIVKNLESEIFRVLQVDKENKIQVLTEKDTVYLRRVELIENEILQITLSDSFKKIAVDDLKLMKFTNRFIDIKNNPAKGLKIQLESISLSDYLKQIQEKKQKQYRESDIEERGFLKERN